jgi:hypothetical protein
LGLLRLGFVLSLFDMALVESSLFARNSTRMRTFVSVMGLAYLGSPLALQSPGCIGSPSFSFGISHCGLVLPIFDFAQVGPPIPLKSLARVGFSSPAADSGHMDATLSLKSTSCLGSTLLLFGLACSSLVFFPSAMDMISSRLASPVRSFLHLSIAVAVFDAANMGTASSSRSSA